MPALRVDIVRFIDAAQPGWVECVFVDAHGRSIQIHEKAPVVSSRDIDANTKFPVRGVVACEVIDVKAGIVRISTARPWGIAAVDGTDEFDVVSAALEDDDADIVDGNADVDSDEDLIAV